MSQQNHKRNHKNNTKDITQQWIENENYCLQNTTKVENQTDQAFRLQHQQYVKLKNKRMDDAIKKKIEEFGQSSSDQDIQKRQTSLTKVLDERDAISKNKQEQVERNNFVKFQKKESEAVKSQKKYKVVTEKQLYPNSKIEILMNSKKSIENWNRQEMNIQQKTIVVSNLNFPFYDLNKFKIFFSVINDDCHKLKINWKNEEIIFASSFKKKIYELPTVYFIFAKVIKLKLNVMGKKTASFNDQKSKSSNDSFPKNSLIYGKILKKSRLISRWSEIFAGITKQGLFYHKKLNEKGELLFERGSVSELWTRFEFEDDFLIVKLFQNGHKIELGIPLQDYTNTNSWLYHLYCLSNKDN